MAQQTAALALRGLRGENPEQIPITEMRPDLNIFDWRQLRRWGISEDRLPPGALVVFREPAFWKRYKWHIIGVLSLCGVEALFIATLIVERQRRRRAKEALNRLNAELEKRIAERATQLEAKTRELETFAYSVAHDLKAPLRGIDGYTNLLLEGYLDRLDEEGRGFLNSIRTSTEGMRQLIDDLLAYSRLERRTLTSDSIELPSFVEALVEEKRLELEERKIALTMNINGGTVVADSDGLGQVVRNYLDNAIKFTSNTPEPRIEIGAEETERSCRMWVRDNGIGFDMKYHDRIFEIFQRLHPADDYPGNGVGLAIVRKAIERMGARAWSESAVGQGATFYLEIPKQHNGSQSFDSSPSRSRPESCL